MNVAMTTIQISVPQVDLSFLKALARKMGWEVKTPAKRTTCHLDKAIAVAETEVLFESNDIDELMSALNK